MAILPIVNQYQYNGKGPFDAKMLVDTYAALKDPSTWDNGYGTTVAFNGMITAVWKDTDAELNGVYLFSDPNVKTVFDKPDVTLETNWHKLCTIDALNQIKEALSSVQELLNSHKETIVDLADRATEVVCDFATFPKEGTPNKLYIDGSTGKAYYFAENNYHEVKTTTTITELYGGSAII